MPAKSKAQQKLFGMALAVRRGELKKSDVDSDVLDIDLLSISNKSDVDSDVLDIVNSEMTDKEIEDFASTKHNGLKNHLKESMIC